MSIVTFESRIAIMEYRQKQIHQNNRSAFVRSENSDSEASEEYNVRSARPLEKCAIRKSSAFKPLTDPHIINEAGQLEKFKGNRIEFPQISLDGNHIEDEFHSFGINVASQLRQLPLERALRIQVEIQSLLAEERIAARSARDLVYFNEYFHGQ